MRHRRQQIGGTADHGGLHGAGLQQLDDPGAMLQAEGAERRIGLAGIERRIGDGRVIAGKRRIGLTEQQVLDRAE